MIDLLSPKELVSTFVTPNPTHMHAKWEMVIFEKGTVKNYINGVPYESGIGDVFLLGPNHLHAIELLTPDHVHTDLYIEPTELEQLLNVFPEDFKLDVLSQKTFVKLKLDVHDFNSITNSIYTVKSLRQAQPFASEENIKKLKSLVLSIIQYVLCLYLSNTYAQKTNTPEWFFVFLHKLSLPENFTKSVDTLVSETNYSHTQFSKLFKKFCGMPLVDYLKHLRLSYAAELLKSTDYSTLFICENCGYDSYSYFERIFKSKFKFSPRQYRKKYAPPPQQHTQKQTLKSAKNA